MNQKYQNRYKNFVRAASPTSERNHRIVNAISGEYAKKIYLEEISQATSNNIKPKSNKNKQCVNLKHSKVQESLSDSDLFNAVQDNNVDIISTVLENDPNKVNTKDEFGWSLLMIACQANSVETVKELLKHNADISIRDKAGNSATSLVIKNKNFLLADIFLCRNKEIDEEEKIMHRNIKRKRRKNEYICEVCDNKVYPDKSEHLSSTTHNINASRGIKPTACYKIPESNRGYQIMLKGGWTREGLGPDGSGKMYPIRTVQKIDKKGLGLEKSKLRKTEDIIVETQNKIKLKHSYHRNRRMEIEFRRQFY